MASLFQEQCLHTGSHKKVSSSHNAIYLCLRPEGGMTSASTFILLHFSYGSLARLAIWTRESAPPSQRATITHLISCRLSHYPPTQTAIHSHLAFSLDPRIEWIVLAIQTPYQSAPHCPCDRFLVYWHSPVSLISGLSGAICA